MKLETAVQALIAALPQCVKCGKPATRTWERGAWYCDEHSTQPELGYAKPLRALLELLK